MNKSMGKLKIFFVCILLLCIIIIGTMVVAINKASKSTINNVSKIYMNEMCSQLQNHFKSIIELRFDMVEGIVKHNPPQSFTSYSSEMKKALGEEATTRNFTFLGLYTTEGDIDVIYGEPIEISGKEAFLNSLNNDDSKIARATDTLGNKLLIMGVSTNYPMEDGSTCTALIAGIDLQNIGYSLELMGSDSICYAHIISRTGEFIIRTNKSENITEDNYFDYLLECDAEESIDDMVADAQEKVNNGEEVSITVMSENNGTIERRRIYFAPLSHSEWYLVCVMPQGTLDDEVQSQSYYRIGISCVAAATIMILLVCFFLLYYRASAKQMQLLSEAQIAADNANAAKSRFLSNMSHDIRTPLNAIIGMTDIAQKNIDNTGRVRYCLDKIKVSGKHLLGLINDILDISKIESGKMTFNRTEASISAMLDDIVTVTQTQVKDKNQTLNVKTSDIQTDWIYCDVVRFNQVLINLVSNALKFTPEGGRIDVTLTQEDSPKGAEYVRVNTTVKDTGIGMSPEFQEKVFDSFVREDDLRVQKIEGTGLGMAITKHIVDNAGGTIKVSSTLGVGTEFDITIDFKRAVGVHLSEQSQGSVEFKGRHILVAEDGEINWEIAKELLSDSGFVPEWADSGITCVQKFSDSATGYYDAILMDLRMPGMNGIEATQAIRAMNRRDAINVPIIAMTADAFEEDARRCIECGMNAHTSKPLNMDKLLAILKRYLK